MIGTKLGPYEITRELGRGGMGHVYEAVQPALGRTVAVKTLLPHLAANDEFVERFLREARATARLQHPGIITIHDVGEQDGTYYFAMEFVPGTTLDDVLRERGPLPVDEATAIIGQVAAALSHAHASGILHRDVKPSNIMIDVQGRAVLTDFGIAFAASETRLTQTGTAVGSPEYMSPEQVRGGKLDQRADLYSLGIVYYQLLTGDVPYHGDSAVSVAFQHVNEPVMSARAANPAVPEHIDRVACRLMAKEADDRFASAQELLGAIGLFAGVSSVTGGPAATAGTAPLEVATTPVGRPGLVYAVAAALGTLAVALMLGTWAYFGGGATSTRLPGAAGPASVAPAGSGASAGSTGAAASSPIDNGAGVPATPVVVDGGVDPVRGSADDDDELDPVTTPPGAAPVAGAAPNAGTGQAGGGLPAVSAPAPIVFSVTSQPPGATVQLDGVDLNEVTPVEISLDADAEYSLALSLDGHESTGFRFRVADLSATQRDEGTLHFPLVSSTPPGVIVVRSSYPATITLDGRPFAAGPGERIEFAPGTYSATIEAPDVFFRETRRITVASEAEVPLILPPTTSVLVGAQPSFCSVTIDGIEVGYVPVTVEIALGEHEFEFNWERLGQRQTYRHNIRRDTARIFEAAPGGR